MKIQINKSLHNLKLKKINKIKLLKNKQKNLNKTNDNII